MHWREHGPPHFHAEYGGAEAAIVIRTLEMRDGRIPAGAYRLVARWASARQAELLADWDLSQRRLPLRRIDPLE